LDHRPGRRHIPERQVPGALGEHRGTVHGRRDVSGLAQVPLRDDLRPAAHPGDFPQVVVRLAADPLADQARHTLGHTLSQATSLPPAHANVQLSQQNSPDPAAGNEDHKPPARKLGLAPSQGNLSFGCLMSQARPAPWHPWTTSTAPRAATLATSSPRSSSGTARAFLQAAKVPATDTP